MTATLSSYSENYRSAQGMKFSETKGTCNLAYTARVGEEYRFPDGRIWKIAARKDDFSGYLSILLKPENDPRIVLSFAGTDPLSITDLITDFAQEKSLVPRQYQWAAHEALLYKRQYGNNLILTGHSLGGGLATYSCLLHKIPTTTLNLAPLSEKTALKYVAPGIQCVGFPVTNYISGGQEFISSHGLWGILPGAVGAYELLVKWGELPKLMVVGEKIPVAGGRGILGSGVGKFYSNHLIPDTAPEVPLPQKIDNTKTFGPVLPNSNHLPTVTPGVRPTAVPPVQPVIGTPTPR